MQAKQGRGEGEGGAGGRVARHPTESLVKDKSRARKTEVSRTKEKTHTLVVHTELTISSQQLVHIWNNLACLTAHTPYME